MTHYNYGQNVRGGGGGTVMVNIYTKLYKSMKVPALM